MLSFPRRAIAAAALLSLGACASSTPGAAPGDPKAAAAAAEGLPSLPNERYTLDNGLEVILHPDPRLPLVAVNVWYHVGALNERPGRSGFAHLFEHMMFQGSPHVGEDQHFKVLQQLGASDMNGTTSLDRTNYYETVPSQELETALWLESDRMGFLLSSLSQRSLDNQIEVVKNERRQSYDNRPYGLAQERLTQLLFPAPHPYHGDVIGSMQDIGAASLADVQAFFRAYYSPQNATLTLAGDFDPDRAKLLIKRYFSSLKGAPKPARPQVAPPQLQAPVQVDFEEPIGKLPRLFVAWPTPPAFSPDEPALDLLAHVISGTRSSRLDRRVSFQQPLAQSVSAYTYAGSAGGRFVIDLTTQPGHTADQALAAVDEVLTDLKQHPPTQAELTRAKNTAEALLVRRLEGLGARADRLQTYNHYLGNPDGLGAEIAAIRAVSLRDLARVQAKYLGPRRVVLKAIPRPQTTAGAKAAEAKTKAKAGANAKAKAGAKAKAAAAEAKVAEAKALAGAEAGAKAQAGAKPQAAPLPAVPAAEAWRRARPGRGEAHAPVLPRFERVMLDNGLTVLLSQQRRLPLISMSLVTRGGASMDPPDRPGLSSMIYDMLQQGAGDLDALAFSDRLAELGAMMGAGAQADAGAVRIDGLSQHAPQLMALLGLAVQSPRLEAKDLERQRRERLSDLARQLASPYGKAAAVFPGILYGPKHPFGHPRAGTPASIRALSLAELKRGYARLLDPAESALIIIGDLAREDALKLARASFGGWKTQAAPRVPIPAVPSTPRQAIQVIDQSPAAQTLTLLGRPLFGRGHPEELPLSLATKIYGGDFSSRLNMNLREDKGYTYGAGAGAHFRAKVGVFQASAMVTRPATAPALAEFFKELDRLHTDPFTVEEVKDAKQNLIRSLTGDFEGIAAAAGAAEELFVYALPLDHYATLPDRLAATTAEEVRTAARLYLAPKLMRVLLVGQLDSFAAAVDALKLGPVQTLRPQE